MKGKYLYIIFLLFISLSFVDCAKRGMPDGGPRDTIPPIVLRSMPENYSTNFKGDEITIYFDEYIKLKNPQQEILISPPLNNQPIITPFSTSRNVKITFNDTLKENTTYTINFGKSIVDNHEENPLDFHKFVFSTGTFIDSLKIKGTITDALLPQPETGVTVMLYEVNENYTDSVIYNKKPYYVGSSQHNPKSFSIENIKAGEYLLIALKDNNNNYTFQPQSDKIGFAETFINVPTDSVYELNLFKENPDYKLARPAAVNNQHILFGYHGDARSMSIEILSETPADFSHHITKDPVKDTLNYWFKPAIEKDTLQFRVVTEQQIDTVDVRVRENIKLDSLVVRQVKTGVLTLKENFEISANRPIISYDKDKISIMDRDSISIPFTADLDAYHNVLQLEFEKEERKNYTIDLLPEAIKEYFGTTNDSIQFRTRTGALADYGFLSMNLSNVKSFPIIVQLVTEKGEVKREILSEGRTTFDFEFINPGKYYVRVIYDINANGIWDTGSFLQRRQPEEVVYYPPLLDIRANWTLNETFSMP